MWLVVGGLGQLGSALAVELTTRGIDHVLIDRPDIDITDSGSTLREIKRVAPDVIINTAAWTAVDAAEDNENQARLVNCDGARNVALAARDVDARLVHISTDYVFDGESKLPYEEDRPALPRSAYGRTKHAGDLAVMETHGSRSLIVRTAWLYSEFGHNFVKTMVRQALAGNAVRVVNDQTGQPTYARDLASHIIDLVRNDVPPGTYHGTNSGQTTWYELTRLIYEELGVSPDLVTPVPTSEYPTRAMRPTYSVLGHGHTIDAGLREMRDWSLAARVAIPLVRQAVEREKTS
jgi:dTDP-4-dehydrorhamnose reductase